LAERFGFTVSVFTWAGKPTKNYGKSLFLMGKSTISMVIFNSYDGFLYVYQRVNIIRKFQHVSVSMHSLSLYMYWIHIDGCVDGSINAFDFLNFRTSHFDITMGWSDGQYQSVMTNVLLILMDLMVSGFPHPVSWFRTRFRRVPVQIPCEVPEGSGAETL
jgi:hypothetical protein